MDFEHNHNYLKALKLAEEISVEEHMPHVVRRQQADPSHASTPKNYWRVTVTIPLVDSIISEIDRFSIT